MSEPLDEDAPLVATVAADAATLLQDATAGSVGYPGFSGVRDAEDILSELARLTEFGTGLRGPPAPGSAAAGRTRAAG